MHLFYTRETAHQTFNGGHSTKETLEAFHHGMDTVFNLIDAGAIKPPTWKCVHCAKEMVVPDPGPTCDASTSLYHAWRNLEYYRKIQEESRRG